MALEIIDGQTAWKTLRSNGEGRYPTPKKDASRLYPVPTPSGRPTFQLDEQAQIFTMGSCFAREVDSALLKAGFKVVSRSQQLAAAVEREGRDESLFNKYTIPSIVNEIRWALDPEVPYPGKEALVELNGRWSDLQLGGSAFEASLEEMLAFRDSFGSAMKSLSTADVIIITLGLSEAWFDKHSQLYLNLAPSEERCKAWPGRFEMRVLDYEEILASLEEAHSLVTRFGKPNAHFLVTVSPVPLLATFRDQDVLVANAYSKAVQRAAVEAFVARHLNVDYFPSYESVALGDPAAIWGNRDYRHVATPVVAGIMARVMAQYTRGAATELLQINAEIQASYRKRDFAKVVRLAERFGPDRLPVATAYQVALSYKQLSMFKRAYALFVRLGSGEKPLPAAVLNAGKLGKILGIAPNLKKN